ncbi:MAG: sugar ABC transporter substrate-binding protein [Eubacteriales bacterium]
MKKKIFSLLLIVFLVGTMVVGCGSDSDTQTGNSSDPTVEPGTADTSSDTYEVGITFSDLSNPVWAELVKEAERYGEDLGVDVTYVDAKNDATKQVTQIENFIQSGKDAIIICAVESNAIKDVTKDAQEEGIKVVSYTQVIDNFDAEYLVDAYNTGYANGERAAQWINENYGDEEEVEWALMDLPRFPEIIDRAEGIKAGIEENTTNTKLVATASALTAEDGLENAENFLQANPDLKVIATIGGGGAVGGNEGMKAAGITDYDSVGLFGIDATEQEILNIINGDPQKSSISLGGGKKHGKALMDMAFGLLTDGDVDETEYMPIEVIDSNNAQEYYDEIYAD